MVNKGNAHHENNGNQVQITKPELWIFGKREMRYAAIGIVLYLITVFLKSGFFYTYFFGALASENFIVVIFGLLFGPWVGFITGFLGALISLIFVSDISFLFAWYCLITGMLGLIAGLGTGLLGIPASRSYKNYISLLYAFGPAQWDGIQALFGSKPWKPIIAMSIKVLKAMGFPTLGWFVITGLNVLIWIWRSDPSQRLITRNIVAWSTLTGFNILLLYFIVIGIVKRRQDAADAAANDT